VHTGKLFIIQKSFSGDTMYEGESVNRSQKIYKPKTCDIRTWKKNLFLDISSTIIDIPVPALCQCVETRSTEVF
jgi:hypothetical protein